MSGIVIDTSVILDMFLVHRRGHATAAKLADVIRKADTGVFLPMHSFFEITSAIMCEKRLSGGKGLKGNDTISEDAPIRFTHIPIDMHFVTKYATGEVPDLKSGDMIFVVFARAEGLDLVTQDDEMYKEARRQGVAVYRPDEYLQRLGV